MKPRVIGKSRITKDKAVQLTSGNKAALARALGITKAAVNSWPNTGPIPFLSEIRIRYIAFPELCSGIAETPAELGKKIVKEMG